jgi:hypothetical protein
LLLGATNANSAVIVAGIDASDRIYLSVPPGLEEQKIDLLPQLNGKRNKKDAEETTPASVAKAPAN